MIQLILMRHAQAEPAGLDADDFARPLTAAGRAAAAQAAAVLAAEGVTVGRLLYSPASRTRETAAIAARELGLEANLLQELPQLYLATPEVIRDMVERHGGQVRCLLVIGHNPGLSEYGGELDPRLAQRSLPTAGVWRIAMQDA